MNSSKLSYYLQKFKKLRINRSKGPAPHKPLLLLSIIEGIQDGTICSPQIYLTPQLIADYKKNWSLLVTNTAYKPNFFKPFYHLKSSGFWTLNAYPGFENALQNSFQSIVKLDEAIEYAELALELFDLLINEKSRNLLLMALLNTYFSTSKEQYTSQERNQYLFKIQQELMHENTESYQPKFNEWDEEEIFVRSGLFKSLVPQVYNHTCCISGLRVIAKGNISMIDACHIMPFRLSHNDCISNGIPLCPNLHRAFDRGIISIDENYKVIVSDIFVESHDNRYGIKQFEGKQILLPNEFQYFPDIKKLIC